MAPRKKTEEKASGNEATDMVLQYLRRQNRPYSAIDVSANLHNKVTKVLMAMAAAAAKILKDLHEQKLIEGRAAGKQIVYHALQNAADTCTTEQLAALDARISELRTQTAALNANAKTLRATLAGMNSTLSTVDLIASVNALEKEKAEIEQRLDGLKKGKVRLVTTEEREAIDKAWKKNVKAAKNREKIAREMWKIIADNLPDDEAREEHREMFDLDG